MDANDLRNLKESIDNLTVSISNNAENIRRSSNQVNDDFSKLSRSTNSASSAQQSIVDANKKYADSMKEFNNATAQSVQGLKNFTAALLTSERSFGKYNGAIESFGGALSSALKGFGPLGAVLGGVVQGMAKVATMATKQADSVLKAYDDLAKVGGAGGLASKQILEMGLQAGLMSKDLGKLTGVMQANSKNIAGLGASSAEGMKVFAQMTAVGTKTIGMYSKLGVSQEDLIKTQGDYISMQIASGRAIGNEVKDRAKLQKLSLEYQDNLLALSAITGENVDAIKQKQKEATYELNWQIKNRQDANKAAELEKQGRHVEAAALRAEVENRNKGLTAVAAIGSKGLTQAVRELQASGTATSKGAQAMIRMGLGPAMAEYNRTIKEGGDANKAAAKLQNAYNEAQNKVINTVGTAAGLSQDVAEAVDATAENVERGTQQAGKDLVAAIEAARQQIEAGKNTNDAALATRAKLTELEIKAGTELERFLAKINPLLSGLNLETIGGMVATGAAVAAATWLGGKLLGGIFGKGAGGMPGIPSTGGVGAGRGAPTAAGRGAPTAAGKAAGRSGNVAGTLQTLGQGGGSMLENAAKGLAAFANPKVAVGAAAFGAAIVAIGAGIAGATWIVSKALPTLAENLQSFEKLNGEKLVQAGKGVGALGAGLAVFGAGGIASGIGSIMSTLSDSIASFFGKKTPVEKLVEFSKLDINSKKLEENAKAFAMFGAAMATGVSGILEGLGTAVSALGGAVTNFFKIDPPLKKFVEFSKLDIDLNKTKNNAEAFAAFSAAMATGAAGLAEGFGSIVSALGGAVTNFFKVDPPLRKFVEFSKLDINAPKTKINAEAFANFSMAMAKSGLGSAASGLGNLVSGIADGIGKLFGNKDAITKFVEFTKLDVDPDKAEKLGIAFAAYVSAMQGVAGAAMPAISGTNRPAAPAGTPSGGGTVSGGSAPSGGGGGGAVSGGTVSGGGGGAVSGGTVSGGSAPSGGGPSGGRPSPGPSGGTSPPITGSSGSAVAGAGGAEVLPNFDVRIGNELRKGGTISWRTNNPGNISFADITKKHGALVPWINPNGDKQQRTVGIAVMPNLEAGENAQMELWRRPMYINRSIASGVKMWVEGKEYQEGVDSPKQYAIDIAKAAGVDVFTKIKDLDDDKLRKLIQKQRHWEGFKPGQVQKAKQGGIFSGPESGYPVELHGNEMVIPNFKIPNMKSAMEQVTKQELPFGSTANASNAGDNRFMVDLMSMMETKFDNMISVLEQSNNTQSQILRYSKA